MIDLDDVQTKEMDVCVGGRKVSVRRLGLAASIKLADAYQGDDEMSAEEIAEVVASGLVYTDSLERVYSNDDVPSLLEKDADVITKIFQEIIRLSFSAFEEAEKN